MKRHTATVEELEDGSIKVIVDDEECFLNISDEIGSTTRAEIVRDFVERQLRDAKRKEKDRMLRSLEAIDTWASLRKSFAVEGKQADPPRLAEAAFAWLAPQATVDSQLGDLQEIFAKNLERCGWHRARWLYWLEVIRAIAPAILRVVKRIGFVGLIIDYFRAKFGF